MRSFFNRLLIKLRSFFYGRNGFDDLAKLSIIASVVILLICGFCSQGIVKSILYILTWVLMGYGYFRILSKNVYKRVSENKKYLGAVSMIKTRYAQRKTHKFFRCSKCKTWLRVPRGRGKITITCVKCGYKFDKKS